MQCIQCRPATIQVIWLLKDLQHKCLFLKHCSPWKRKPHLRLKPDMQYKRISEQHVNKKFGNIKPTHTDNSTAAVTMTLAQFNLELVYKHIAKKRRRYWEGELRLSDRKCVSHVRNNSAVPVITNKIFTGKSLASSNHPIDQRWCEEKQTLSCDCVVTTYRASPHFPFYNVLRVSWPNQYTWEVGCCNNKGA